MRWICFFLIWYVGKVVTQSFTITHVVPIKRIWGVFLSGNHALGKLRVTKKCLVERGVIFNETKLFSSVSVNSVWLHFLSKSGFFTFGYPNATFF